MREGRCTIDSSCVIALHHLGLLPQLSMLFSTVLIPKAVREELSKRRLSKDHLRFLFRELGIRLPWTAVNALLNKLGEKHLPLPT